MNTIQLKFFDNIYRFKQNADFKNEFDKNFKFINNNKICVNRLKCRSQIHIVNFFEFYIDDIPLHQHLDVFFNHKENLLDGLTGIIDINFIERDPNVLVIDTFFNTDSRKKNYENKSFNDSLCSFYECAICRGLDCNMFYGKITSNNDFYFWEFYKRDQNKLIFKFKKESYVQMFSDFFKNNMNRCNVKIESLKKWKQLLYFSIKILL